MDPPNSSVIERFVVQELNRLGCPVDVDAVQYLAQVWLKLYGADLDKLTGYLEILADYDYGITETGKMDRKTVEFFLEEELGYVEYLTRS